MHHWLQYWNRLEHARLAQRCALALALYSLIELFYLSWKLLALYGPLQDPSINSHVLAEQVPISTGLLLLVWAAAWLCAGAQHASARVQQGLAYAVPLLISVLLCYHGYIAGAMNPTTGLMLVGMPMLGMVILGARYVYPALIIGTLGICGVAYWSLQGDLPYAPIFVMDAPPQGLLVWGVNIALFSLPLGAGLVLLFDMIIRAWQHSEQENRRLSQTDPLTGLFNRRSLNQYLHDAALRGDSLSIAIFDIDCFKKMNDQCGHLVGDRVLQDVADVLRQHTRPEDWLGRFGGEEFIVLLPNTNMVTATQVCEHCRLAIQQLQVHNPRGQRLHVSVSVGVVGVHAPFDVSHSLSVADAMLYQAKQQGRNRVVATDQVQHHSKV